MTPYTLTLYFQLFSNMIMASIVIYMAYLAYTTIRQDINFKIQRMTLDLLDEISRCLKQYTLNKCHLSTRPPAIEQECNYLDKCQNQDPSLISRSNLTSEILAEITNSFFNKLNYKSISIVLIFLVINLVSNYYIIGNFQYNEINRLKIRVQFKPRIKIGHQNRFRLDYWAVFLIYFGSQKNAYTVEMF